MMILDLRIGITDILRSDLLPAHQRISFEKIDETCIHTEFR